MVSFPGNTTISDDTPDLNFSLSEASNVTYNWDGEGNISGCRNCTSYNTTYGEYVDPSESSLVMLLHFNEDFGSTAYDDSGKGNNGTINGANWTTGRFGNALRFSCVDASCSTVSDYVEVPHSSSLNIAGAVTIAAWIKPRSWTLYYDTIVEKTPDDYAIYLYDGYLNMYVTTVDDTYEVTGDTQVVADRWYCVVGTFSGFDLKVYLDGVLDQLPEDTTGALETSGDFLRIGGYSNDNSFNGTIDEVAIFDRALSGSEIAQFCNKTLSGGSHYVTIYATNQTGGANVSTDYFTLDTAPPSRIDLNDPLNNSVKSTSVTFNWTSFDASPMTSNLTIDGVVNESNIDTNSGTPTYWVVSGLMGGQHSWSVKTWDTGDRSNTSATYTFTVDTTPPTYSSWNNTPPSPWDNENVTCYSYWADDNSLGFAVVEENGTGTFRNHTVNLSATGGWGNYTITAADLGAGLVQCRVYANDSAGNVNATPVWNFSVGDTTPPIAENITYTPNTSIGLDPNVTINVSADMVEFSAVDTAILQYREANLSTWNNYTMNNTAGNRYEGNFTPDTANNWSFRIWANDTLGNANTSSATIVNVAFDWGWTSSPTSFEIKSGGIGSNISIGDLNITSESDYNLSFDLSSSSWIYFDTSPGSASYDVNAGESRIITVNASLPPPPPAEYSVTIIISATNASAVPSLMTTNATIIAYDGPYLYVTINTYPNAVTQGDTGVNLTATLYNFGNDTANNVSLAWELPGGWINASGVLNKTKPNLHHTTKNTLSSFITANISSSAPTGFQTLQVVANSVEDGPRSDSVDIYVNATPSPSIVVRSGGDYSPPEKIIELPLPTTYSPTPAQRNEILDMVEETFEVVRGRKSSFEVSVTNPFENSTIVNLGLKVGGTLAQYMKVRDLEKTGARGEIKIALASEPGEEGLGYNETQTYEITIAAPTYIDKGTYPLNLTIMGNVSYRDYPASVSEKTGEVLEYRNITFAMAESKIINLAVHIISKDEGNAAVEEGTADASYMQNAGFSTKRVNRLLEAAKMAMTRGDYEAARKLSEEIARIKEAAFSTRDAIYRLKNMIRDAEEIKGLKVPETKELLSLTLAAFEREDYETALQRVNDAELVYSSETRGKVNYAKMLLDNLAAAVIGAVTLFAVGIVSINRASAVLTARRLEGLDVKEINIMGLMREAQENYYVGKTLSQVAYKGAMDEYTKRLTEIKGERAKLRAKRAAMIGTSEELKSLEKESQNLKKLIHDAQDRYYNRKAMSKREYDESMEHYTVGQIEIEEAIAVLEMKVLK